MKTIAETAAFLRAQCENKAVTGVLIETHEILALLDDYERLKEFDPRTLSDRMGDPLQGWRAYDRRRELETRSLVSDIYTSTRT